MVKLWAVRFFFVLFEGDVPVTPPALVPGSRFSRWLDARFYVESERSVQAKLVFRLEQEGPPGHVHGGLSATLLDEAMGIAVWEMGRQVVSVNLNVTYKRAVPLGVEVTVTGRVERFEGRKAFTSGTIVLPDGAVAVEATGVFVEAPGHIIAQSFRFDQLDQPE